ncbi:MAG TPA: hypothetical protein DEO65_02160 [Bacillus bacterium]|uniref:DUF350 domain-containing protein n=1 Tax=Siminovitchia fordii TaxID=254759 RepID=A0ABQ4K4L6_9BACI|nr:hypothetical protein [Siminovitchia fordii]GIN20664.1 hypothetical protein J1TS3_17980 [Siminovitchia fordii]HBZ08673.1 hypothetical protein [Bacillus sp. (in: firmicutes)]
MDLFLVYYFLPLLFSILWFLNLVKLLENLKLDKNIQTQKILGCVLSIGLTFSILLSILDH